MGQLTATLHGLAGVALLGFWYLYALVLPFRKLREGIWHLALNRHWTWISMLGGGGAVTAAAALVLLSRVEASLAGELGTVGVLLAITGLAMLAGNLFWEAILWPVLARRDPQILAFDGPIYSSRVMLGFFGAAGLAFAVGFMIVGIALLDGSLPPGAAWCLIVGAPLFALGPAFGGLQMMARSVGITALAAGQLWLAAALF